MCEEAGRHRGRVSREGDSFAAFAFTRPSDALDCAIAADERLVARARLSTAPTLSVRMVLDTGEASPHDGAEDGPLLDHASALLSAAYGGQLLCSEATVCLLRGVAEPDVGLTDLGLYLLDQARGPERLFGVTCPRAGLTAALAPQAPVAHRGSLPPRVNRFFGREGELRRLSDLVLAKGAPVT